MSVVVDTDVVSFMFKSHPVGFLYDTAVAPFSYVSFQTIAELERWTLQYKWGQARRNWLKLYLDRFAIVPYSAALGRKWAEVMVEARSAGRPIECADAWVAATALLYGVPLVTHNRADYAGLKSLSVISHAP